MPTSQSLLVIDGAAGQVKAAVDALRDCGVSVPVVGLAKRLEEVWVVNRGGPGDFCTQQPCAALTATGAR